MNAKKLLNTSLAAKGALTNRLQRRTACKIQNGRQGAPKWQRGSGKVFGRSRQLSLNKFFDPSTPSMRKGRDEEKKIEWKIMRFIVATNVVASGPPKRRPTGTPYAHAKIGK